MKKILNFILVSLVLLFSIVSFIFLFCAFTYEGEINPNDFDKPEKWKMIKFYPDPINKIVKVFLQNQDSLMPINIVFCKCNFNGELISYRYFKYGEPYLFLYNTKEDKYMEYKLSMKERTECMECHKVKTKKLKDI